MNIIEIFIIIGVALGIISFIFGLLSFLAGERLYSYLEKYKYEKWCELTSVHTPLGDLDGGARNFFKGWKYINSDQDSDDMRINKLKIITRKSANCFCMFFIGSLGFFAITVVTIFLKRGI